MKSYPLPGHNAAVEAATNDFVGDFLYLKSLAEQVIPLADRYFPPDQRRAMERELLAELALPHCTYETFVFSIDRYLAGFHNEHARIVENPKPIQFSALYPFRARYVSNDLCVLDLPRECNPSLLGQKIVAINDRPVASVEQKLFGFVSAENLWTKRAALESFPFPYARPAYYHRAGLTSSVTNRVKLELGDGTTVEFTPKADDTIQWQRRARPPHPITARSTHQYDCRIFPDQRFAYLQFNACFDKTAILDGLDMVKPWIRPLIRGWLAIQFHRKKAFGVLRGIYDPERPVFKDYLGSVIRDINAHGITNLVIDLRWNGGGASELCNQLVYHITPRDEVRNFKEFKYNLDVLAYYEPDAAREFLAWYRENFQTEPPSGRLLPTPERHVFAAVTNPASVFYVAPDRPVFCGNIVLLANEKTGSAAALLTALIQDNRLGTIVGTSTANNPTGPTGMTPFLLPRSGIMVSLPTEYDERALPANGEVLQPKYWVEDSIADIHVGRDAALEEALKVLRVEGMRSGPLTDEDIDGAVRFLKEIKESGQQPGWSKGDKGAAYLRGYSYFGPKTLTFWIRKDGDASIYEYTVRTAEDRAWKLQRARRLNRKGEPRQEYPIPRRIMAATSAGKSVADR